MSRYTTRVVGLVQQDSLLTEIFSASHVSPRIKRPNDPIQLANLIMRIATGEAVDEATDDDKTDSAKALTAEERSEAARKARTSNHMIFIPFSSNFSSKKVFCARPIYRHYKKKISNCPTYQNLFGRAPDAEGIAYWTAQIN